MKEPSIKEALAKQIYYLESIKRQLEEYKDFVSSREVLAPSIGNEVLADNIDWLDCHVAELKRNDGPSDGAIYAAVSKAETPTDERAAIDAHLDKALAPFQPDGERREAIALKIWHRFADPSHIEWKDETHKDEFLMCADDILASGLVQDEAGWRDISTAPKDMTEIIVLCGQKDVRLGWYFAPSSTTFGWRDQHQKPINPTRWMPLPANIRSARDLVRRLAGTEKEGK